MNAFTKRALFSYGAVKQTGADTADSRELVQLLFQGLTDRIAATRNALASGNREDRFPKRRKFYLVYVNV